MKPIISGCIFSTTLWSVIASQVNPYKKYETPRPLAIDLIFPKNQTYKPQFRFPVVFGFNPTVLWPFDFQLYYTLDISIPGGNPQHLSDNGGFFEATHKQTDSAIPGTVKNPMLIINATAHLNNLTEARVLMRYWVGFLRTCNGIIPVTDINDDGIGFGPQFFGSMKFSISNSISAQIPDLDSVGNCSQTVGLFNVLGEYEAKGAHSSLGTCPVVQIGQPEKNCGLRIDDALKKRISVQILNETCGGPYRSDSATDWQSNPSVSWPNPTATTLPDFCDSSAVKNASVHIGYLITLFTMFWAVL